MIKIALLAVIGILLTSCTSYSNKKSYKIAVGERVEIYYSTNSCCYYCVSNEKKLGHILLIDRKTIDPGPSDCAGCAFTAAFVFEGKSVGKDTVELKKLMATVDCDSNKIEPEKYIIEVK